MELVIVAGGFGLVFLAIGLVIATAQRLRRGGYRDLQSALDCVLYGHCESKESRKP